MKEIVEIPQEFFLPSCSRTIVQVTDPNHTLTHEDLLSISKHLNESPVAAYGVFVATPVGVQLRFVNPSIPVEVFHAASELHGTKIYEEGSKDNGVSVEFLMRLTYLLGMLGVQYPAHFYQEANEYVKAHRHESIVSKD